MPKKAPTICNSIGCSKLTYKAYCDDHKHDVDRAYADMRTDVKEQKFYKSLAWKKLREAMRNKNPLCVHCLTRGLATPMDVVDHIIPLKVAYKLRLVPSNLQCLCNSCHNIKTAEDKDKYNM